MKIAIVGSREIIDCQFIESKLLEVLKLNNIAIENVELVSGGARGVDFCAEQIAKKYGLSIRIFFPNYQKFNKKAPLIRNTLIVQNSDLVIAFPSATSRGTYDTINKAKKLKRKLYIFRGK